MTRRPGGFVPLGQPTPHLERGSGDAEPFFADGVSQASREGRAGMRSETADTNLSNKNKGSYMSLAREIAPHLPLLRRYARALTGTQESGDAFVAAALEAIVARPEEFPRNIDPRVGLYQMFHRIWASANVEVDTDERMETSHGARMAQERLKALPPLSRQALLLTTLESFTAQETGQILERPPQEIHALLEDALDQLDRQTKARILIIEDETVIAMDLSDIVTGIGHEVCGVESTATGAVDAAERER